MDSRTVGYSSTEENNVFPTSEETLPTNSEECFLTSDHRNIKISQESVFSPLAPPFQSRVGNDYLHQPEVRPSDTGSLNNDFEESIFDIRLGNRSYSFLDGSEHNAQNYFKNNLTADNIADPVPPAHNTNWTEGSAGINARNAEMIDTYDFLIKSLSSANNYVSTLTREQLSVLRSIHPNLLYEFLQEVAKACSKKRTRRPLPNECAFCKNNGENEESYSSHSLKDWRGRVLCPVLRAFRCPRCGATGDRAHTIKYCPEAPGSGLERSGGFLSRRRTTSTTSLFSNSTWCLPSSDTSPTRVTSSSSTNLNNSIWSNFA